MGTPIVLVDSASGSDTCSNATLRGTNASTNGGGTVVTLDGSPNLSGLAANGTEWIQVLNSGKNFSKITAFDNTAKTVTVSPALTGSMASKTWAINQPLASIGHANSRLLFANSGAGDWQPGWVAELQSGHTETITARLSFQGDGDTTTGPMILRSVGTRPIITANQADYIAEIGGKYKLFSGFQVKNSNAGCSYGFVGTVNNLTFRDLIVGGGTQDIINFAFYLAGVAISVESCDISDCDIGVGYVGDSPASQVIGCRIHDVNNYGIRIAGGSNGNALIDSCLIYNSGSHGILIESSASVYRTTEVIRTTIDTCTNDAISITGAGDGLTTQRIINCILTNTAKGVNFSDSPTLANLLALNVQVRNNTWNAITQGRLCSLSDTTGIEFASQHKDPNYVGSGDYTPQEATLKGTGFPTSI